MNRGRMRKASAAVCVATRRPHGIDRVLRCGRERFPRDDFRFPKRIDISSPETVKVKVDWCPRRKRRAVNAIRPDVEERQVNRRRIGQLEPDPSVVRVEIERIPLPDEGTSDMTFRFAAKLVGVILIGITHSVAFIAAAKLLTG